MAGDGGLFITSVPGMPRRKAPMRNRERDGIGKSKNSHVKHRQFEKAIKAQLAAYRRRHHGRIVLIDGNAGDGKGVVIVDLLTPIDPISSMATAELLMTIAEEDGNADVILCESNRARRAELTKRFPSARVLKNNADAINAIQSHHHWALWVSDPCGPSGHGHEAMAAMARRLPSDFVIALNEGWITTRLKGTEKNTSLRTAKANATARVRYYPMLEPEWWRQLLNRRHLSRTKVYNIAPNFKPRIMVVANYLSDGVKRPPFEVIT